MITILHGDNIVESRNIRFTLHTQAQAEHAEILVIDGTSISITDLVQALETQTLFHTSRVVFIDNMIKSLRLGEKRDAIINYLCEGAFETPLILWESKGVGRSIIKLKKQPHVTVKECKLPATIFAFVDSLRPGNMQQALTLFHAAITLMVPEVIMTMLVRQFRILLAVSLQAPLSELMRTAPWQRSKLEKQAHGYTSTQLKQLYKSLLLIDYLVKTGRSAYTLTNQIETLIMKATKV